MRGKLALRLNPPAPRPLAGRQQLNSRSLRKSGTPGDAAALAAGIEREILWRLVTGPKGATVRQIGLADSRLVHVSRAIPWIHGHHEKTLRAEELAALATIIVSSFHRHFRAPVSTD